MSSVDHGHENVPAALSADQIAVEGSAGSDTDTGGPLKSDTVIKDGPDFQHHARSNSVKKPTTFKAVSVTKNFLAKAGTPAAPNPKVNGDTGEKRLWSATMSKKLIVISPSHNQWWRSLATSSPTTPRCEDRERDQTVKDPFWSAEWLRSRSDAGLE